MKITSFNPGIVTTNLEEAVKVFEALGFEKRHNPSGTSGVGNQFESVRMKDANGFYVDISQSSGKKEGPDRTHIRMNVSDFDEAWDLLTSKGFKSSTGGKETFTGSARADMLLSPSGFGIALVEHLK